MDSLPITLQYRISKEEYFNYNQSIAKLTYGKARKKALIVGSGEMILAVGMFVILLLSSVANLTLYLILDLLLFLLGGYSVLFYLVVFPRSLKKSSDAKYDENSYLQNEIEILLYADKIKESGQGIEKEYDWEEISSIRENENLFFVIAKDRRCIIIPKRIDQDGVVKLFLNDIKKEFEIKGSVI